VSGGCAAKLGWGHQGGAVSLFFAGGQLLCWGWAAWAWAWGLRMPIAVATVCSTSIVVKSSVNSKGQKHQCSWSRLISLSMHLLTSLESSHVCSTHLLLGLSRPLPESLPSICIFANWWKGVMSELRPLAPHTLSGNLSMEITSTPWNLYCTAPRQRSAPPLWRCGLILTSPPWT
jgi:hypothetical protein